MADETLIKAYLVHLGFEVDEQSLQRFSSAIADTTTRVGRLLDAVGKLSPAVAQGVVNFANNLEGLYFASAHTGASPNNLKALDYAADNAGASSADVRSALESLQNYVRDNPAGGGVLEGLGLQTRDANGALRDTADLLVELGEKLKSLPLPEAQQQAKALGINDNALRAAQSDGFAQTFVEGQKHYGGLDQNTVDNAHQFMESARAIGAQFDDLSIRVQAALEEKLGPDLQAFSSWFSENAPLIAERIAEVVVALVGLAEQAGPYLKGIADFLLQLDKNTDGWSSKLIVLSGLLAKLAGAGVISGVARLAASLLTALGGAGTLAAGAVLIGGDTSDSSRAAQVLEVQAQSGSREAAQRLARIQLNNNPFSRIRGISEDDVKARADAILAKGQAATGASTPVGPGLIPQLESFRQQFAEGADHKANLLLQASQNVDDTRDVASDFYLRPLVGGEGATPIGTAPVQLNQTTQITVHGASNPADVGTAVAGVQDRVNQDLVRNVSGAVN